MRSRQRGEDGKIRRAFEREGSLCFGSWQKVRWNVGGYISKSGLPCQGCVIRCGLECYSGKVALPRKSQFEGVSGGATHRLCAASLPYRGAARDMDTAMRPFPALPGDRRTFARAPPGPRYRHRRRTSPDVFLGHQHPWCFYDLAVLGAASPDSSTFSSQFPLLVRLM